MKNLLEEKVIDQQIAGVSMENYMADLLEKLENIIDAQRVINKSLEMEISMLSQGN